MPDPIRAPKKILQFSILSALLAFGSASYAATAPSPAVASTANNNAASTTLPNAYELVKRMDAQKREMARLAGEVERLQQQVNGLKQALTLEIKQELSAEFEQTLQDKVQIEVDRILSQSNQSQTSIQPADTNTSTQDWATAENPLDTDAERTRSELEISEQKQGELAYAAAYAALKNEGAAAGINQMQDFIASYPDHHLIANAHYWLGEFYLKDTPPNVSSAKEQFTQVITEYKDDPNNDKQSKALYRLAAFAKTSGDSEQAKQYVEILLNDYAESGEAKLAKSVNW